MARNPNHEIRIGLIKVSILRKKSKQAQSYSFKLERLFRDGEHWRKSTRLDQGDLLIASKALELAYDWVESQSTNEGN
jgi:hypothetical protein